MVALVVSFKQKIKGRFVDLEAFIIKVPAEPCDHIITLHEGKVIQVCQQGRPWERYYKVLRKEARIPHRILQEARRWIIAHHYRRWSDWLFRVAETSTKLTWSFERAIRIHQDADHLKWIN